MPRLMKLMLALLFATTLPLGLTGCGGGDEKKDTKAEDAKKGDKNKKTPADANNKSDASGIEKLAEESVELYGKMPDILSTISDKESAAAANEKLKALAKEVKALGEKIKAMDKPSKEVRDKLDKELTPKMMKKLEKISIQTKRIMAIDPQLVNEFQEGMQAIQKAAEETKPDWAEDEKDNDPSAE